MQMEVEKTYQQEKQMKDSLHTRLSACSPDTFNYRIFIEYNNA